MSEERRQTHSQDPAEGSEEEAQTSGAEKAKKDHKKGEKAEGREPTEHPQDPAEGGEDEVEAPGADKP